VLARTIEVDDLELARCAADERDREVLATAVCENVDSRVAEVRSLDLEPSTDCGEVPQEDVGVHGSSSPACRLPGKRRAPAEALPLRPSPGKEIDAEAFACHMLDGARSVAEPPMSKPLAYPSTLDHRPAACART
jgi:hypothetical protein